MAVVKSYKSRMHSNRGHYTPLDTASLSLLRETLDDLLRENIKISFFVLANTRDWLYFENSKGNLKVASLSPTLSSPSRSGKDRVAKQTVTFAFFFQ